MKVATADQYERAILQMVNDGKLWLSGNIGSVQVQFNFPREVAVASGVERALQLGFISVNDQGKAFGKAAISNTPGATVIMLKVALELIERGMVR